MEAKYIAIKETCGGKQSIYFVNKISYKLVI